MTSVTAGEVKAGDTVTMNVKNTKGEDFDFDALLGMYDESGKLINVIKQSDSILKDAEKTLSFTITNGKNNVYSYLRLYIWNKDGISPIEQPYTVK